MLYTIERDKRRALGHGLHYDLVSLHHIGIEAVERLTISHHHIVGDIDNIVDWT